MTEHLITSLCPFMCLVMCDHIRRFPLLRTSLLFFPRPDTHETLNRGIDDILSLPRIRSASPHEIG